MRTNRPRQACAMMMTALLLALVPVRGMADSVTVFAAASLSTALEAVGAVWTAQTGHAVHVSYAGSSALARQIQQGAPADIFISASTDWMDAVEVSGDLRLGTRRDLLGNRLALIAHGRDAAPVVLDGAFDLAGRLGDERLAMALVDAVPSGMYGKSALMHLGLWDSIASQVAQTDNVRAALTLVAQNETPLGIVFTTDAAEADDVTIIGIFPEGSHAPILYPAAITAQSDSPVADAFLEFLSSDEAKAIWTAFGFTVPD